MYHDKDFRDSTCRDLMQIFGIFFQLNAISDNAMHFVQNTIKINK